MSDAPLPSSFDGDADFYNENRWQKFTRRVKQEPLIPLGVALTCWAFFGASRSIRQGNGSRTNQFFRYRLYAQSFTIVAMLGGSVYYNADRLRRKEYNDLIAYRKAQEKKEAWIRELEARDLEDKEWRDKLGKVRNFEREEREKKMIEEKRRREGRSDDNRGVLAAVKGEIRRGKEKEMVLEAKEDARAQEEAAMNETEAKMPVETPLVGVEERRKKTPEIRLAGDGGLFGWKRLRDLWEKPEAEKPAYQKSEERAIEDKKL